jgi:hypothetical protein
MMNDMRNRGTRWERDIYLMNSIYNYFNCGKLYEKSIARYAVHKITDINEKIIPYLKEYPFQGSKALDF